MKRLLRYLVLPAAVTPFEAAYLRRMNKLTLGVFAAHPPIFALVAYLCGTSVGVALVLSAVALIGPVIAYFGFADRPRLVSVIYGVTAMLMGGVLVYVGQGPMQIEMHFYFFVLLALLATFANPMVVVAAAAAAATHHLVMWLALPRGIFNYDATIWTVLVHATFVVIESVAACFVARSFFDNVIGLERIVGERTKALDGRNRDMTSILDNVSQGFVPVGLDGAIGGEWSRALTTWFGEPRPGMKLWELVCAGTEAETWMRIGFESLVDGFMPVELTLDQLPHRISRGGYELHVDYQPVGEPATSVLVMVSDITAQLAQERAEAAQRELIAVVEKAFRDRAGYLAFVDEAETLIAGLATADLGALKRGLHTLKGNCGVFGVKSVASTCHDLESEIEETGAHPGEVAVGAISTAWHALRSRIDHVLGSSSTRALLVDWNDYQAVLTAMPAPTPAWAERVRDWGHSSTRPRLERCADYARLLGDRLGKTNFEVEIVDHGVRVPTEAYGGLWSAFVHAIRNVVDHGIDTPEIRIAAGKPERARIVLETTMTERELRIEVSDDGAGIDWDRIAAKARDLGLPATTRRDLEEAMFASGVSTRDVVSETSGRGVGMDALRTACRELGGRVEVESERGLGTRIRCTVSLVSRAGSRRAGATSQSIPVLH